MLGEKKTENPTNPNQDKSLFQKAEFIQSIVLAKTEKFTCDSLTKFF